MSGRSDNNRNGTSGLGASNQSNQKLKANSSWQNPSREDSTSGKSSAPQQKTENQSSDLNYKRGREEA
ncbi:MAG: hypothetical protein M3Y85_08995 [Bacteroidota bacterium]|nr:hypothetical protein [Bacteroidota bacterium]